MLTGADMAHNTFSIKNCKFAFKCPRAWERLGTTANDNERHCASCCKLVYLCQDEESLARHMQAGHCVAFEDVANVGSMLIGQVESGYSALEATPVTSSGSEKLTNLEQERLRQKAREINAYAQKAFK